MSSERSFRRLFLAVLGASLMLPACGKQKVEVNPIVPKITVNRERAPLGSPIEVTYTWSCEPGMKKLAQEHHAFVHFLDKHGLTLFTDDHLPSPPPSQWEPGKTYSYTRTVFIPIYPYVGEVDIRVGLVPSSGRGQRVALKAEDVGLREYRVAKMEFLPQTENIYLVEKEGWHNPESSPQNPGVERIWTKKDAWISFKNPKKDVILYLEADTNFKAFTQQPVLTLSINGTTGIIVPIKDSEVILQKVRFKAQDLGQQDWVDLRFTMNASFVPALLGINATDDRELGLLVYHRAIVEADKVGTVPPETVVDAAPLPAATVAALKVPLPTAVKPAALSVKGTAQVAAAAGKGAVAPAVKKPPTPAAKATAAVKTK